MNTKTIVMQLLPIVTFTAVNAMAQGAVNFDEITMRVVSAGAFEARQLGRPESDSILRFMDGADGGRPAGAPQPTEEMQAQFEQLRTAIESGDEETIAALRAQMEERIGGEGARPDGWAGRPEGVGNELGGVQRDEIRALFESGDAESVATALEQVQALREAGEFTRPEGAPDFGDREFTRPADAPSVEEIRALVESGDLEALAELRARKQEMMEQNGRPQ